MTTATREIEISNRDNLIDVRDVIARVEELEADPNAVRSFNRLDEECASCGAGPNEQHEVDCKGGSHSVEAAEELITLTALLDDLRGNGGDEQWRGDWYPVTMVRESYFEDFARQEAEDLGLIKSDAQWPYTCIDWERAASELKSDYALIEFDGVEYLYR